MRMNLGQLQWLMEKLAQVLALAGGIQRPSIANMHWEAVLQAGQHLLVRVVMAAWIQAHR